MNGPRYDNAKTVEEQVAAVVMELFHSFEVRNRRDKREQIVDYADVRDAIRPYIHKELTHARIEEVIATRLAGQSSRNLLVKREAVLQQELADFEGQIVDARERNKR